MNTTVDVALYARLSVEDETNNESTSIQTQKAMLADYCREHGFHIVDYYVDDGETGTNFERPEFQRMLRDIDAGKINTVICKDLSRFGRNYYEAGMYLDKYFVERNIRFIAIQDNVDSAKGGYDLTVPFLNMMNDYYARGISAKTKAAKQTRAKQGMFLGSKAPYGYQKDPEDKHHLIIDEAVADIVCRIFTMAENGWGFFKIAKTLQAEGIPNPQSYADGTHDTRWHITSVQKILQNPVYCGDLVQGRRGNRTMHGKQIQKPESEWIIVENTHEPLVDREQWDTVQKQIKSRKRSMKNGEVQMFAGLLYCADCGHALTYSQKKRKDGTYHGAYSCWMYKTHGKEYCASHYIRYDTVYDLVLIDLRSVLWNYRHNKKQFKAFLERKFQTDSAKEAKKLQAEYEKKQSRFEEIDRILCKLYEDSALGKIPESRYEAMSAQYESEQREIKAALPDLRQRIEQRKAESDTTDKFVNLIKKYTVIDQLDAAILNELIDKIVVHHKEVAEDGRIFQQVEIYYRFIGKLEHAAESEKAA